MSEKKIKREMLSLMARSSLKSGKLRNTFMVVTIFLSVSLLTVILLFGAGSREETRRRLSHSQHAAYFELDESQISKLESDKRISYSIRVKAGITSEQDDYSVTPRYVSSLSEEIRAGTLTEGVLPEQADEAAVEAEFLKKMNVSPKPGQEFEVTFYDGASETFVVSGILDGKKDNRNYTLILSEDYANSGSQLADEKYMVYVKLADAEKMEKEACRELIYQIGRDAGIKTKYVSPSKAFLDSLGTDPQMLALGGGTAAVILLACILVIYGVFYISVVGRIHQFGQLRTIGMTRRQIRKLVRKEGSRLFACALPFGLAAGGIAGYLIKPEGWSFINAAVIFLIAAAVNYAITMVSVLKPAKIASDISPMEALRYTSQEEMKEGACGKTCRRLSPLSVGLMNFTKNKKKTAITMLSLAMGGILFMTAATYMSSFDKEQYSRQLDFKDGEFNITIPVSAIELDEHGLSGVQSNSPLSDNLLKSVEDIPGVRKVIREAGVGIKFDYKKRQEYNVDDIVTLMPDKEIENLKDYTEGGTADLEKLISGDYVLIRGNDVVEDIYGWTFAAGDKITFHFWDGEKVKQREVEVLGFLPSDYRPLQDGWFFMPEEAAAGWTAFDNYDTRWIVSTEPEKEQAVGEELQSILADEHQLNLETLQARREMDQASIASLFGAITGLSVFIMMFSILSMMNTLITNIVTRKQELAMLESIGMTKRQRRNMILGECFLLSGSNIVVTLTAGTGAGYVLCRIFENAGLHYMSFTFPVWFVTAYIAILLIVPALITVVTMHEFSKEALVERLRGTEC